MSHPNQQDAAQEKIRQVQTNFGAAAADYVTSKVHASGQDLEWVVQAAALTGTEHVLDVATGAGHTAFALAPYAAEIVALDITREMLAAAQKWLQIGTFTIFAFSKAMLVLCPVLMHRLMSLPVARPLITSQLSASASRSGHAS